MRKITVFSGFICWKYAVYCWLVASMPLQNMLNMGVLAVLPSLSILANGDVRFAKLYDAWSWIYTQVLITFQLHHLHTCGRNLQLYLRELRFSSGSISAKTQLFIRLYIGYARATSIVSISSENCIFSLNLKLAFLHPLFVG